MKNLKTIFTIGAVIAFVCIAFLIYSVFKANNGSTETNVNNSVENTNTQKEVNEPLPSNVEISDVSIYGTRTAVFQSYFSLDFVDKYFKEYKATVSFPGPNGQTDEFNGSIFKHEIQAEHCALSGKCSPTTIDMSWTANSRNESFDPKEYPDLDFKKVSYGDIQGYEASIGAEGEGIVYTFIPRPDPTDHSGDVTIIIYRTYIDENVVTSYKNVKDFLPIKKQVELYKNIVSSLD